MLSTTERKLRNSPFVDQHGKSTPTMETGTVGEVTPKNGQQSQDQNTYTMTPGIGNNSQHMPTGNTHIITPITSNQNNIQMPNRNIKHSENKDTNYLIHTGEKPRSDTHIKDHKIDLVMETYNCYGFSRTADYVLDRLANCDIMGLTETWFRPNELNTIKCALQNHPNFKDVYKNYNLFSKSGMTNSESDYSGRPFRGV